VLTVNKCCLNLNGMTLISAADAAVFDIPDTHVVAYAAPSRGSTQLCLWRIDIAPGSTSPLHHMDCEEIFLCVDGSAVVAIDGEERRVGPGDCLVLPAGADFSFQVDEAAPFKAVACIPAGGKATMTESGDTIVPPWAA
jgi:mannose-6-phosphate isomerase-like protein (cupin superfamily)